MKQDAAVGKADKPKLVAQHGKALEVIARQRKIYERAVETWTARAVQRRAELAQRSATRIAQLQAELMVRRGM